MKQIFHSHHPLRHIKSFKHALEGILHAVLNEANFRVQIAITIAAIFLGFYYDISQIEWGFIILSMGMLLTAELMNTAVENFMDHLIHEHHEGAKVIKDISAGFVLTAAFTALAILILVFGHYINISR